MINVLNENINVDLTIDVRGQLCPYPMITLKKVINNLSSGQILKLITTDPICPDNVDSWCENTGNILLRVDPGEDEITIYLKKA